MEFIVPANFCELSTGGRSELLIEAKNAIADGQHVYFNKRQFTNYDELVSYTEAFCKISDKDRNELTEGIIKLVEET
jgi:hypothetical protein